MTLGKNNRMPGWRSLYLYNSTGNSIIAEEEEERAKIAYDMAEMERIFRIKPFPPTGDFNFFLSVYFNKQWNF